MTESTTRVSAGHGTKRTVHVVPHTHWDREWYQSFQTFRLRLVDLLDRLIPQMENDPAYARFLLDGQLAVVDDYLAVRPEAEEPLRRLVGSGRISIGPWYTLPDEFLVSGETLVRNLQRGLRVADRFGGAMAVGYLPDMFGHVAQMPQVLAGFGFEHAVVWRGVPAAVDRSGFWWQAPDGSAVRAEYLPQGYGNGSALPDDAKAFVAALDGFGRQWGDLLVGPLLWMNGTDHQMPQPWLGRVVAEANALQDNLDLRIVSLPEHLATVTTEGLPTWRGELRAGARANLLMGVTSNRVDVRQAAARAERAVERLAEPLSALFLPAERWPAALLDEAWRNLILNSAHDSVCACSIDEVCDAVLHRYAEAGDIADGLADRALAHLAARVRHDGPLIVNPTSRPRGGVVRLALATADAPPGTQLLRSQPAEAVLLEGPPELVVPAAEELEWMRTITGFSLESAGGEELVSASRAGTGSLVSSDTRVALAGLTDPGPVRLRVRQPARVTVLAHVGEVAGFGWTGWTADGGTTGVEAVSVTEGTAGRGPALANGLVTVTVDPADGTFAVDGHSGLGRLVDGGDCGDTYNWCPPARDTLVDRARVGGRGRARAGTATGPRPDRGPLPLARPSRGPGGAHRRGRARGRHAARAAGGGTGAPGRDHDRQPQPGPPVAGALPAADARGDLPGRDRVRVGRAGRGGRGWPHRGAAADLSGAPVRPGGRAHRRARRRGRVRAGGHPGRPCPRTGTHAAALHRDAVAGADADPPAAGGSVDPPRGSAAAEAPDPPLRARRRRAWTRSRWPTRCSCRCRWSSSPSRPSRPTVRAGATPTCPRPARPLPWRGRWSRRS